MKANISTFLTSILNMDSLLQLPKRSRVVKSNLSKHLPFPLQNIYDFNHDEQALPRCFRSLANCLFVWSFIPLTHFLSSWTFWGDANKHIGYFLGRPTREASQCSRASHVSGQNIERKCSLWLFGWIWRHPPLPSVYLYA